MKVSIVLCTYSEDRYDDFSAAADSVLGQTYDPVELVVVVDGNRDVYDLVRRDYGGREDVVVHCNDRNRGLSYGRNKGAELASGDVVGFMDDDAVADGEWVAELVAAYRRHDAVAVGGRMAPLWVAGEPAYLPPEFYFLVGVTYRGFPTEEGPVRNTFSSNLSFRRDAFLDLGGFKTDMGKKGENDLQGGETELCARLYRETGERVIYNPDAVVSHRVYDYRIEPRWLLERSFWQGYSKRRMEEMVEGATATERAFVGRLLGEFLPDHVRTLVRSPTADHASRLGMSVALTGAAGVGYAYATARDVLG